MSIEDGDPTAHAFGRQNKKVLSMLWLLILRSPYLNWQHDGANAQSAHTHPCLWPRLAPLQVATWSSAYARSIKSGTIEPLALEPLADRPPDPFAPLKAAERIANRESPSPSLDISHSMVVFPQPADTALALAGLQGSRSLAADLKPPPPDRATPRPLFITSGAADELKGLAAVSHL
jgi:hypothetical protein